MFRVIRGTVKRNAFAHALRLDRRLSGRHVPTPTTKGGRKRGRRPSERSTLTRAAALALWRENRRLNAASARMDHKTGWRPLKFRKAA